METRDIREDFQGSFKEAHIDKATHTIRDVAIASTRVSPNGYEYSHKAFDSITSLADQAKIFINHPSKSEQRDRDGVRSLVDWAGMIQSPKRSGDKISGHFQVRPVYFGLAQDIVKMNPDEIGFSINARCLISLDNDGKESVMDVEKLHSIDLVASCALNRNLWESTHGNDNQEDVISIFREYMPELLQDIKEGILTDKIKQDEVHRKANSLMYKANDLIYKILRDEDIKDFSEKKKQIEAILDDLEKELGKILPKIKPEEESTKIIYIQGENDMVGLSDKAKRGLEYQGEKEEREQIKKLVLQVANKNIRYFECDSPTFQKMIEEGEKRFKKEHKEREKQLAQEKREATRKLEAVSAGDKAAILASVKR